MRVVERDERGRFVKGHYVPKEWYRKSSPYSKVWPNEKVELLRKLYPIMSNKELSRIFDKSPDIICAKANSLGLHKTEETLRRIRKEGRPSHRKGLTLEQEYGVERAKEIREKLRRNARWRGKKLPPWLRKKLSEKLKGRINVGDKNPSKRPEVRRKIAETLRNGASSFYRFKDHPEWRRRNLKSCLKRPTNSEKKVIDIIEKYGFPFRYTGDGDVIIGRVNPDFIHNDGEKKVIEVFGRAFHDPDYKYAYSDKIPWYRQYWGRKSYYAQFGYDCLILWDDELQNEEIVVSKIKSFLGEG